MTDYTGSVHSFHAPEVFSVAAALLIGSAVKYGHTFLNRLAFVPFPLMIILIGVSINVVSHYCAPSYSELLISSFNLSGDFVMLMFFPLTLFYSAYRIPLGSFRLLWKHIVVVSFFVKSLALLITALASTVILSSTQQSTWGILTGLLFASIVSTADPIDTSEAIKGSGCDRNMVALTDTTALFGNGMIFVWYSLIVTAFRGYSSQSFSYLALVEIFFLGTLAAPAFGLGCAVLQSILLKHIYNSWHSEVLLILSTPFAVSWFAYYLFGACGMLSVIVLGLWTSYTSDAISIHVKAMAVQFLAVFSYIFNVLIFLLVGFLLTDMAYNIADKISADWWRTLYRHLALHAFTIWSMQGSLSILRPLLRRMVHGEAMYDLRNVFLLTWTTPRGATSMILLHHVLDMEHEMLLGHRRDNQVDLEMSVIITIALSQLVQCTTMPQLLILLGGCSEHSESQVAVAARKGFLDSLENVRRAEVATMRHSSRFSDVDWQIVAKYTSIKRTGEQGSQAQQSNENPSTKNFKSCRILTANVTCPDCVKTSSLPHEILEMYNLNLSKLAKAQKMSFYKQFESGMLLTSAMKVLCGLTDDMALYRKDLTAQDIRRYLYSHFAFTFRKQLSDSGHRPHIHANPGMTPPRKPTRRMLFEMVQTSEFDDVILCTVFFHVVLTIAGWIVSSNSDSLLVPQTVTIIMVLLNCGFAVIYTAEAAMKLCGPGMKQYFGAALITWNRIDFLLLLLTYADLIMDLVAVSQPIGTGGYSVLSPAAIRALRLARIFRASRALRLLKPFSPQLLRLTELFITNHLYEAYNVAHGFIMAQEDILRILSQLISFVPLASGFTSRVEQSSQDISHEIGILNQQHSDIATAVKTRLASRAVWNAITQTVTMLKEQGIIEEDDYERFENVLEINMKKLSNLPHRMPLRDPEQRLRNLPWCLSDEKIYNVLRMTYEKKSFEMGSTFLHEQERPDGIYVIVNGLVQLSSSKAFFDHRDLGELYSTDNIKLSNCDNMDSGTNSRRMESSAVAETRVDVLFISAEHLFLAFKLAAELERNIWKHIAVTVAMNIEVRLRSGMSGDIDEEAEHIRLSKGDVRLVRPGRVVADLDLYGDIYLLTGSAVELQARNWYFAPVKLPHSVQDIQLKAGRETNLDADGDIIYPGYAVLFMVPHDGTLINVSTIHESQLGMDGQTEVTAFSSANSMQHPHHRRESVFGKIRKSLPRGTIVDLLAAGFDRLAGGQATSTDVESPDNDNELQAARHRAQAVRHVRTGSAGPNQATATALQMALGAEVHKIKVKATGYHRSSTVGETAGQHNFHPNMQHNIKQMHYDDQGHWIKNEESVEVVHEQRHRLRFHWWNE